MQNYKLIVIYMYETRQFRISEIHSNILHTRTDQITPDVKVEGRSLHLFLSTLASLGNISVPSEPRYSLVGKYSSCITLVSVPVTVLR